MRQQREVSAISISSIKAEETASHIVPEISPELFRKYVAFARKNIFPVLTEEAMGHIHSFYLSLRSMATKGKSKSIPITTRQEEAMVRLAEASARVRLSQEVTLEDAKRATELMMTCLRAIGMNPETGEMDVTVWNSGVGKDQRTAIKSVLEIIRDRSKKHAKG
jgi:replicative DNA helicase Mcm